MLSDRFDPTHNSLNAMRMVLALLVIVSHAPVVAGVGPAYAWADLDIGGWAVAAFFAISGWLIATSRLHLGLAPFMWRRLLRILPGFWLVLLLTAAVFAPLSALAEQGALTAGSSVSYVFQNAFLWIFQPSIDGTLTTAGTTSWNLSLWTLAWEMLCYIGVGLVFLLPVFRERALPMGLLALLTVAGDFLIRTSDSVADGSIIGAGLRLSSFFFVGAALRMAADRVPLSHRVASMSVLALSLLWYFGLVGALGQLPIAYLCLYLGIHLPLQAIAARNDLSYGVYVYGFPVGQLLVLWGAADTGMPLFITFNLLAVLPLAALSWFFVERRALTYKYLVPSRARTPLPHR